MVNLPLHWELPSFERKDFAQKKSRFAILVPVINEGERIRTQLKRMLPYSSQWDTFLVDGGSTDGSLDDAYLRDHLVRSLLVKTGPGRLSAQLRLGLAAICADEYEGVVLIDGNNKDNPAAIPEFIEKLELGFDHIQGSRFISGGREVNTPRIRYWGIRLLHAPLLSIAARYWYTDTTNGFRAYSRRFLLDPRVRPFRNVFGQYELHYYLAVRAARLGFRVTETPVERAYPDNCAVPTKIMGWQGNVLILKTLWKACNGEFTPSESEIQEAPK